MNKTLAEIKQYEGNYPEDYKHENGNYVNVCCFCMNEFMGHKRRVICKVCNERVAEIERMDEPE